MIKPISLRLANFKAHGDTTISLDAPIVHVIGKGRQGKTSLRYALEYALSGTCPGLTANGKLADQLIKLDESAMGTAFAFDYFGADGDPVAFLLKRGRVKNETHATLTAKPDYKATGVDAVNGALAARFGITRDLVSVLMDAPGLLRSGNDDASRILSSVLAGSMTLPQMMEHVKALAGAVDPAGPALTREMFIGADGKTKEAIDRAAFAAASKKWREERRALGAERRGLSLAVPPESGPPDDEALAGMRARLVQYRTDQAELLTRIGGLQQKQKDRAKLIADRDELAPKVETFPSCPSVSEEDIKKRMDLRLRRLNEISALETCKEPHPCPVQYAPQMCPLSLEKKAGITVAQKKERDSLWAGQAIDKGLLSEHEKAAGFSHLNAKYNDLRAKIAGAEDPTALLAQAEERKTELESWITDLYENVNELAGRKTAWDTAQKARERDVVIGKRLDELAVLIPLVDPSGIPAAAAQGNCAKVARFCNRLLEIALPGYKVGFAFDPEAGQVLPVVLKPGFDQPVPTPQLSDSEATIIGAIIGRALGVRAGFPLTVVDRCESIEEGSRIALADALRASEGTTILISVVDDTTAPLPFPVDVESDFVYVIENGAATQQSLVA